MTQATQTQREIHLKSRPQGMPKPSDFELVESPMPEPGEGELLVENEWFSVDPYMRGRMREGESYVPPFELGQVMEGGCVGRVVESKHPDFNQGDYVLGNKGWRTYWTSSGNDLQRIDAELTDVRNYLGVMGLTGMTAYVGLLHIAELHERETVFVSAASGAVGSIACQIAKLHGCRVIGSAGSEKKIAWLRGTAGVDEAFDYHAVDDISVKLAELAPDGIDVYFDNVGGDHLEGAIDNMNNFGRVACCGMISGYNDTEPQPGPRNLFKVIGKRLRLQGFIVRDHQHLQPAFQQQMAGWIEGGKVHWEETITEGIENAPQAFIALFEGDKMGKALVKV